MELKSCPFCGGKTGDSATLCGQNYDGKWWCYNADYNTRTPDLLAEKVIEAAILHKKSHMSDCQCVLCKAVSAWHIEDQKE